MHILHQFKLACLASCLSVCCPSCLRGTGAGAGGKGTEHWSWGRGKRGEVKNQGQVVGVSMAEGGRIGRRGRVKWSRVGYECWAELIRA